VAPGGVSPFQFGPTMVMAVPGAGPATQAAALGIGNCWAHGFPANNARLTADAHEVAVRVRDFRMYFIPDVPRKHSIDRFSRGPARGDHVRLGRRCCCAAFAQKAALPQFHLEQMSSLCFELGHPAYRQSAIGECGQCQNVVDE